MKRSKLNATAMIACAVLATTLPLEAQMATTAPATTMPSTRNGNGASTTHSGGVTPSGNGLLLNFQDVSIDTVLNELSASAGFIVVKEVKPEGRVTLVSRQAVSPTEAVSLLNTVLRNAGYAAIQQERILKIVNKDAAKRLNIPVRTGNDPKNIAVTDELITQVIPLRYADATQLKNDLQPLISTEADFASNASSNALIITDTSANARRLAEIVAALDTSVADSVDVRVFQLKFANASTAATLINSVFGNMPRTGAGGGNSSGGGGGNNNNNQNRGGGGGGGGGNPFGGGGGGGGPGGGGFQRFIEQMRQGQQSNNNNNSGEGGRGNGRPINAGSDDRTNSLVVSGPPDSLDTVAKVIKELDANPASEETTFLYRLRNAQAVSVESTLNGLFNGQAITNRSTQSNADILRQARANGGNAGTGRTTGSTSGTGRTGGGFGGGGGGFGNFGGNFGGGGASANAQRSASGLEGQVTIIADVDTNSLLVRTSPANYERVKAILDDVDRPVAQVLIKVLIAEVTHDNGFDLGAEFSALNVRATDANGNPTRGSTGGSNFNIPTNGSAATGLVVQLLEENFTATIRALETAGKLDVLSRPYILASDNQLASIVVGQEVPIITRSQFTDEGTTNNTVDRQDVGILLDVIPHINPDGLVILDVAPEISALSDSSVQLSEGVTAPIINKRSAQTHVGVRTGQTIVIGGLMEDRLNETISKVPLLGDIPGLGALFRRHIKTKRKTELLIFLTPHVAAAPEALPAMTEDELKGVKLVPRAVGPGVYDEHLEGMRRGDSQNPVGGQVTIPEPEKKQPIPTPNLDPARPTKE